MRQKTYHFYFDEGGWLGFPTICITTKKMYLSAKDGHISNYYFGKLSKQSILRVLLLFVMFFKINTINNHNDTELVITLQDIKSSGGGQ